MNITPYITAFFVSYLSDRGVYPPSCFERRRIPAIPTILVKTISNPDLEKYFRETFGKLEQWIEQKMVNRIALNIISTGDSPHLIERLVVSLDYTNSIVQDTNKVNTAKSLLVRFPAHIESMNLPPLPPVDGIDFHIAFCMNQQLTSTDTSFSTFRTLPSVPPPSDPFEINSNTSPSYRVQYLDAGLFIVTVSYFNV
jgi:hypothetical protein